MLFKPEHPFSNYDSGFEIYNKTLGRFQINLCNKDGTRRTILKSRYTLCVHLGYEPPSNIHVDHIDNDKRNDNLNNLQLLSASENIKKYSDFKRNGEPMLEQYICSHCGNTFIEDHGIANCRKKQSITGELFCSMACSVKSRAIKNTLSLDEQNKIKELRESGLSIKKITKLTGYGANSIMKYQGDYFNYSLLSKEKQEKVKQYFMENAA